MKVLNITHMATKVVLKRGTYTYAGSVLYLHELSIIIKVALIIIITPFATSIETFEIIASNQQEH